MSTSSGPARSRALATKVDIAFASARSAASSQALTPRVSSSVHSASPSAVDWNVWTTTLIPASARPRDNARPTRRAAPVTRAVLWLRDFQTMRRGRTIARTLSVAWQSHAVRSVGLGRDRPASIPHEPRWRFEPTTRLPGPATSRRLGPAPPRGDSGGPRARCPQEALPANVSMSHFQSAWARSARRSSPECAGVPLVRDRASERCGSQAARPHR